MRKLPIAVAVTLITLALSVSVALAGTKPKTRGKHEGPAATKGRHKHHRHKRTHKHHAANGEHKRTHKHHAANGEHKRHTRPAHRTSAPVLRVSGTVLKWNRINKIRHYVLATIRHPATTRDTTYRVVKGTSFKLASTGGHTIKYGLRADVRNAAWSKEVSVTVRKPQRAAPGHATRVTPPPAPAAPVTTSWPGPSPASPLMRVGVNSVAQHNYIANLTSLVEGAGVTSDRIDVGTGSSLSFVTSAISTGLNPLVLYNPPSGNTPATYAAQVLSLATRLKALGLADIEFVNEPNINGWTPQTYAAAYAAAHTAIAGMGMTLIAYTIGDYQRANGSWSQDAAGGGWMRDFAAALPAPGASMVDAWAAHLYGNSLTAVQGEDSGWAALPQWRAIAVSLGSNAPWYITEIGWNTSSVSTAVQAQDTTAVLNSALANGYVAGVWFYTIIDDGTGQYGLFDLTGGASSASASDERPAFKALASWMAAHASTTDG